MDNLKIAQIILGVLLLFSGILLMARPKRVESEKEDILAIAGTFLLVLGFVLLTSAFIR